MKNFLNKTILLFVGVAIATVISYVSAGTWSNPTASQQIVNGVPSGNVDAPVNVGTSTQDKDGMLTVVGFKSWKPAAIFDDFYDGYVMPSNLTLAVNGPVGAKEYCDENGENCINKLPNLPQCSNGQVLVYDGDADTGTWNCGDISNVTIESATSSGIQFATVSSGGTHSCGIAINGDAYCWGDNTYGQLGIGQYTDKYKTSPSLVSGNYSYKTEVNSITTGNRHSCAIANKQNGIDITPKVVCWGNNTYFQLGAGSQNVGSYTVSPVDVMKGNYPGGVLTNIGSVYSKSNHTCAKEGLDGIAGAVYCWGYNAYSQLGNNTVNKSAYASSPLVFSDARSIAVGNNHTCVITSAGNTYCWGYGLYGQLGQGNTKNLTAQTASALNPIKGYLGSTGYNFSSITAGNNHTCGITSEGDAFCWGYNYYKQLGSLSSGNQTYPQLVSGFNGTYVFSSITAGDNHTCAIGIKNSVSGLFCWGLNTSGQLGIGSIVSPKSLPEPVAGLTTATSISAGDNYTCVLKTDKHFTCWGNNSRGQLGNGIFNSKTYAPNIY